MAIKRWCIRKNICWKCERWNECFKYRYTNKKQDYMTKIKKKRDNWGQKIIYVEECLKYKFEMQPDLPLLNRKEIIYITTNRLPKKEDLDKIK